MSKYRCLGGAAAIAAVAAVGTIMLPAKAEAWWRGGWCCRVGFGFVLPPVVIGPPAYPPPVYYPPPYAYYAPPARVWIAPHWQGNVWVPGHWS